MDRRFAVEARRALCIVLGLVSMKERLEGPLRRCADGDTLLPFVTAYDLKAFFACAQDQSSSTNSLWPNLLQKISAGFTVTPREYT